MPLSVLYVLAHQSQLLRESFHDSRVGISGSYDLMTIPTGSGILTRDFRMEIVHQISVSVFEGLRIDICGNPPPA